MNKPDPFAATYPVNILVSDTDPGSRAETINLLIELGYDPHEAVSDKALLSLAEKGGYDIIMMNVRISSGAGTKKDSGAVQESRPLLIGMSPSAKLACRLSANGADSEILIFRPTTRKELMVQLKSCSILAGKYFPGPSYRLA
jgi:CheY-like chemotaxis protein